MTCPRAGRGTTCAGTHPADCPHANMSHPVLHMEHWASWGLLLLWDPPTPPETASWSGYQRE